MQYIIVPQLETKDTDEDGVTWGGVYGLPAFEVVASNAVTAESIALWILGPAEARQHGVTWYIGIEEIGTEDAAALDRLARLLSASEWPGASGLEDIADIVRTVRDITEDPSVEWGRH